MNKGAVGSYPLLTLAALVVAVAIAWGVLGLRRGATLPFAGARMIQLTRTGHASRPLPSPDGTQLAYAEERCGNGICRSDLMIREMNGDGIAAIVAEPNKASIPISWSPDGRWVLFGILDLAKQEVVGIQFVSQRGGTARRVADGAMSAAFVANDTLIVLSQSGPPYWIRRQTVPDGAVVDSVRLPFTGVVDGVSASMSGRWLMARTEIGRDTVRSVILDRNGRATDTTTLVQWDPSARDALLTTTVADTTENSGERVLIRRRITGQGRLASEEKLATFTVHEEFRTISADGKQLFFELRRAAEITRWTASRRDTKSEFHVGRVLELESNQGIRQLSPRGDWLLYPERGRNGIGPVEVEPFNGGERVILETALTDLVDMAFSPRDDSLAVVTSDGKDRVVITLYPLPSGRPVRISSHTGRPIDLEWLSDGRLVSHDTEGRSLHEFGRNGEPRDFPFPDSLGSIISTTRSPVAPELAILSAIAGRRNNPWVFLSRMDMNSGSVTLISRIPTLHGSFGQMWWSTDGYLRFVIDNPTSRKGTLMRVPVVGGAIEEEPLLTFAPNGAVNFLSHDRLRAVVSSRSYTTDIWVMGAGRKRNEHSCLFLRTRC